MLEQLLRETSLRDLLALRERGADAPVVAFDVSTATVGAVLARLNAERVRSAPVVACQAHGIPMSRCGSVLAAGFPMSALLGFVEVAAAVDLLLHALPQSFWPPTPDDLEAAGAEICALPVTAILRTAGAAPAAEAGVAGAVAATAWPCVTLSDSVETVLGMFSSTHVQHLCVKASEDSSGSSDDPLIVSVVSQSDIIKFLAARLEAAPELARSSLAALGLAGRALAGCGRAPAAGHSSLARGSGAAAPTPAERPSSAPAPAAQQGPGRSVGWRLATVPQTASALDAFRCMHAKSVSGVAILGKRGDLVGHLGASDARVLSTAGAFSQLLLPVREFLGMHPRAVSGGGVGCFVVPERSAGGGPVGAAPLPLDGRVLCAMPTSPLTHVVTTLAKHRVHRMYVADSDSKPVGVVTCTDVLAAAAALAASR